MYKNNLKMILTPVIIALAVVAGMFINSLFIRKDFHNKQELFLPVIAVIYVFDC